MKNTLNRKSTDNDDAVTDTAAEAGILASIHMNLQSSADRTKALLHRLEQIEATHVGMGEDDADEKDAGDGGGTTTARIQITQREIDRLLYYCERTVSKLETL